MTIGEGYSWGGGDIQLCALIVKKHLRKMFRPSEGSFHYTEADDLILFADLGLVVVAAVASHNYIKQEARSDLLLKNYSNEELVVIDSDDDNDNDETLAGLRQSC